MIQRIFFGEVISDIIIECDEEGLEHLIESLMYLLDCDEGVEHLIDGLNFLLNAQDGANATIMPSTRKALPSKWLFWKKPKPSFVVRQVWLRRVIE